MSTESASPHPLRLLHLEDNVLDAELIHGILRPRWPNCSITRVQTRDEFVTALDKGKFNLILSDFSLPGFNGLAALEIARRTRPEIPYIFLSGTIGEENAVEALRTGATDYIIKDRMGRLVPAVQRALDDAASDRRRRRVEARLQEHQELFTQLAEQSSEVYWFVGLNPERILFIGPAIERIWGRPPEHFYDDPRAWLGAIHPDDRERVNRAYDDCVAGRVLSYEEEYRVARPDGTLRWVLDSGTLIRNDDGVAVRISGIAKDITERKAHVQRLHEQAELLDKARDAIIVSDLEQRVLYWNRSAERIFGWSQPETMGRAGAEMFFADALRQIDTGRTPMANDEWHGEVHVQDKQHRRLTLDCSISLIRDGMGKPKSHLIICTDVSQRHELEQQLLRAQRLESIGMLAGGIAHDLNNVLAPVLMAVGLLQQGLMDPSLRHLLGVLETSALHGAGLLRQILAFARGADGERTDLQVGLVIRDVAQLLRETLPRSITLETEAPKNLALVRSNSTHLGQVLMNLGVNARDAMPEGGRLRIAAANTVVDEGMIRAHPGARTGPHVLLTVSDTGTGIPPHVLERIFDPFFTTKPAGKGTGLGLSTVIGIVRADGGFLDVSSRVGEGTEFRLYFPAVSETAAAETTVIGPAPAKAGGETILVIDDEESIRAIAEALLMAAGYRVLLAADGPAGVALFREKPSRISAVLTDIMLPGMQGAELVGELRSIDPDVRVVAMSGIVGETSGLKEEPGRLKFLQKPMTGLEVIRALQSVRPVA
ncbi:MAG TPA: PAS domain S-box protein [Candidatus Didemnitutus sp.]|nr:PAS domain S-box protein [Candidatus Didemnitutus sp.]